MKRWNVTVSVTVAADNQEAAEQRACEFEDHEEFPSVVNCVEIEPPGIADLPKTWRKKLLARPTFLHKRYDRNGEFRFVAFKGARWTSNGFAMLRLPVGFSTPAPTVLGDNFVDASPKTKRCKFTVGKDADALTIVKGESGISRDYKSLVEDLFGGELVWRQARPLEPIVAWKGATPVAVVMPVRLSS